MTIVKFDYEMQWIGSKLHEFTDVIIQHLPYSIRKLSQKTY